MDDSTIDEVNWLFAGSRDFQVVLVFVLLRAGIVTFFSADADVIDFH